jgi:hypothetical protein
LRTAVVHEWAFRKTTLETDNRDFLNQHLSRQPATSASRI